MAPSDESDRKKLFFLPAHVDENDEPRYMTLRILLSFPNHFLENREVQSEGESKSQKKEKGIANFRDNGWEK